MTWPGQVVHVVRKDLGRARWLILGWAALVALLTLQIVVPAVRTGIPGVAGTLLLFVLGAGFAAWLVQGDAPHRQGAHWPGLPLAPSAVLAAKVFLAFGVGVLVPLAGQFATLIAFPVAAPNLPWLLARSSVSMGAGITLGLVLGSVTDSVGKAAALLIGVIILGVLYSTVSQFLGADLSDDSGPPGPGWRLVFGPLGALAAGTFLLYLYRRGRVARFQRFVGAILALGCVAAALTGTSLTATADLPESPYVPLNSEPPEGSESRVEVVGVALGDPQRIPVGSDGSFGVAMLEVRVIDAGAPAGEEASLRTWLEPTSLYLVDSRGEVVTVRDTRFDWSTPMPEESGVQPPIGLRLVRSEAEGILAGELSVEVRGLAVTRALRLLPPLPLVPGAAVAAPGIRVSVLEPEAPGLRSSEEASLRIRLESLLDRNDSHPPASGADTFLPLRSRVELRFPTPTSSSLAVAGASSGTAPARFLLAGVRRFDATMHPRPSIVPDASGTVSVGIWEHVRSEPVVFRVPPERITVTAPRAGGPS